MIFKSHLPDVEIPKIGIFQYITSNPHGIDDDKVIFINGITDKKLTYGQFKSKSKRFAAGLINKLGFKRGDVLALISPNHLDFPVILFGTIAAGGKVTTLKPQFKVEECTYQLKDCNASVIIVHPQSLKTAIESAALANIHESKIFLLDDEEIYGFQPFSTLISHQEIVPVEYTPEEAKSTTAYICYSSGTTGKSKGVEITHTNMVSNITQLNNFEKDFSSDHIFMGTYPFCHIFALNYLLHYVIFKGASCVFLYKFELEVFCRLIQDYKINVAPVVPPIVVELVKNPIARQYDLSSLKITFSGAAPLSKELSNEFVRIHNTPIKQGYGLTEMTPITHLGKTDQIVAGSVGVLIPNMECKIISDDGRELGYNEAGELYMRGPNVMKGYLNNKEATNACIDSNGWFRTGDVGYVDPQGNFFIVDRIKELIKYKGIQVAPAELEAILLTHKSIADAAVIGIYISELATELPAAYVVLQQHRVKSEQTKQDIKDYVSEKVSPYKELRGGVHFIDEIPKSPSGKILRRLLREKAKNELICTSVLALEFRTIFKRIKEFFTFMIL